MSPFDACRAPTPTSYFLLLLLLSPLLWTIASSYSCSNGACQVLFSTSDLILLPSPRKFVFFYNCVGWVMDVVLGSSCFVIIKVMILGHIFRCWSRVLLLQTVGPVSTVGIALLWARISLSVLEGKLPFPLPLWASRSVLLFSLCFFLLATGLYLGFSRCLRMLRCDLTLVL